MRDTERILSTLADDKPCECRGKRQERIGEELTDIAALVDDGAIEPHIHERFRFNEVAAAHRLAESGEFRGKLLLTNN